MQSGESKTASPKNAAPSTGVAKEDVSKEVAKNEDIPIKLPPRDTAKMAAALRRLEASKQTGKGVQSSDEPRKTSPFVGNWSWTTPQKGASFTIHIYQTAKELRGDYCAKVNNGAQMDCITDVGEQFPAFIAPLSEGGSFETAFTSYTENEKGMVKISLEGDRLHWQITKAPARQYYAPQDAILKMKK